MALLKQCFCYSLRQGSFIIGSYSLVVYCVAFAVELWWIVESLLILPAPAYTLCALYFFDFIMAAILLFGLLVRQRKYLMSWTLMTVLSFFPEAGMVLFMSLYYWPAHKFEYGVIELVYWSLRAIFNIFGAVCVCSLYLTWRDEELILGRLHDLTLANVETGSTGVGVLRNGNFTGTLKGNNSLAYQNYAYVDSSPGLPDNLSYKNPNTFHSKNCNSPTSLHSFYIHQQRHTKQYYFYRHHHHGECAQRHLISLSNLTNNCCVSTSAEKAITSLPILWTDASSKVGACCAGGGIPGGGGGDGDHFHCQSEHESLVNRSSGVVRGNLSLSGGGGGGACGAIISDGRIRTLFYSTENNSACSSRYYYDKCNQPLRHFKCACFHHRPPWLKGWSSNAAGALLRDTVLTNFIYPQKLAHRSGNLERRKSVDITGHNNISLHSLKYPAGQVEKLSDHLIHKSRQSSTSSSSQSVVDVPKIKIVICTEVHGSIETKVIRQPHADSSQFLAENCLEDSNNIPLSQLRRAISESPRLTIMEGAKGKGLSPFGKKRRDGGESSSANSSVQVEAGGSANSMTSIIVDEKHKKVVNKKYKGGGGSKGKGRCCKDGDGTGDDKSGEGRGRRPVRIFNYLANVAKCCVSPQSVTSLLTDSGSCIVGGGDINNGLGDGLSHDVQRGLFNTRSFTLNSDMQGTPGTRASMAMKSEFNPAMLFDPAYRKSRISELGIAGIGLEPPGQIPIGTFNRMNRSRSLWNVSNEEYWNRPPPSRPVSMGYVNHIHQLDQLNAHKDCCLSVNNNSNATMNLNKQMIMKGFGGTCGQGYRNPIHGSTTSIATSIHPAGVILGSGHDSCGASTHRDPEHRRNWLATGRRAQSVDGLNHFYHRYYGKNIAAHHNLHPGGILSDHHSQDWSKSSLCPDEPSDDLRNYQDIAL